MIYIIDFMSKSTDSSTLLLMNIIYKYENENERKKNKFCFMIVFSVYLLSSFIKLVTRPSTREYTFQQGRKSGSRILGSRWTPWIPLDPVDPDGSQS